MLAGKDAAAALAVSDMEAAQDFYENTLGLTKAEGAPEDPGAIVYQTGSSVVLVYQSQYAGTNKATAATWAAGGDFDGIVQGLKDKGVTFEHYDGLPGTTRDGDVHTTGGLRGVWLKDPDGNILSIIDQSM
jgi:catechol 2,3-dioxygenase-like lactoylglutathione lyase family enzyme